MSTRFRPAYTVGNPLQYFKSRADGHFDVTVVGNGPLHESDRVYINRSSNIIRFNDMNFRRPREPTSLRVVRYPSAIAPRYKSNATVWAVAPSPIDLPNVSLPLLSWNYEPALTHLFLTTGPVGWMKSYHVFFPSAQVLEPWADSVRVFENCASCGLRCYSNQTSAGASTGGFILSELQSLPLVRSIDVFGMNWGGGYEHTDFVYTKMVESCCTKCFIHPTASSGYGDDNLHWDSGLRNIVATSSLGVGGVIFLLAKIGLGGAALIHGGKFVHKKVKQRREAAAIAAKPKEEARVIMPLLGMQGGSSA